MKMNQVANTSAKAAHVNMMTDTVIANLPLEALRSILRGVLGVDPKVTPAFHDLASQYLENTRSNTTPTLFVHGPTGLVSSPEFPAFRSRYRCLIGCGQAFEALKAMSEVLEQGKQLIMDQTAVEGQELFTGWDSDLVQALTAVQKELSTSAGMRSMSDVESEAVEKLWKTLTEWKAIADGNKDCFPFQRGFSRLQMLLGLATPSPIRDSVSTAPNGQRQNFSPGKNLLESVSLGTAVVPRMFMGLWQFSSPAWGTASVTNIHKDFRKHVDAGFIAYDMADHYGDAEVTFGQFRSSQPDASQIYCATKWCVFEPVTVSKELVDASITERLTNINSESVELLQFHWQDYTDTQFVEAARLIETDVRVRSLGLCNFDTKHMDEIIESGVKIVSNQVQFSLIDLRPTFQMAESCTKHKVKLLTYGSLCGGLLADKWLGQPAPNLFDENMTPSHRKYLEMIIAWGGWTLFQELLSSLAIIGKKYDVSLSIVAIRWVLDHDYVGAVIIGARMGISEHVEDNLKVFSFKLDDEDQTRIQSVLKRCRAQEVFEAMGDCGAEYRQ